MLSRRAYDFINKRLVSSMINCLYGITVPFIACLFLMVTHTRTRTHTLCCRVFCKLASGQSKAWLCGPLNPKSQSFSRAQLMSPSRYIVSASSDALNGEAELGKNLHREMRNVKIFLSSIVALEAALVDLIRAFRPLHALISLIRSDSHSHLP